MKWLKVIISMFLLVTSSYIWASDVVSNDEEAQAKVLKQSLSSDMNTLLQQKLEGDTAAIQQFTSKHKLDCGRDGSNSYNQCGIYIGEGDYPYLWLFLNDNGQAIAYMGDVLDDLSNENKANCKIIIRDLSVCFTSLMDKSSRQVFLIKYKKYLKAAN